MMKLRINPIVAEDLKNIREYIAEDNEEMAVKIIQEIYARIENIQQFPYMGATGITMPFSFPFEIIPIPPFNNIFHYPTQGSKPF